MLRTGFGDDLLRFLLVNVLTGCPAMKVDGGEKDFGHQYASFAAKVDRLPVGLGILCF